MYKNPTFLIFPTNIINHRAKTFLCLNHDKQDDIQLGMMIYQIGQLVYDFHDYEGRESREKSSVKVCIES